MPRVLDFSDGFDTAVEPTNTGAATVNNEFRTVSSGEASAKQLTLTFTPIDSSKVLVDVEGVAQETGVDFTITGANLIWSGLALDGVITTGDKIRIYEAA